MTESVPLFPPGRATTIWTAQFTGIFAAVTLLGSVVIFLGCTGSISFPVVGPLISIDLATLAIHGGLAAVCLLGLSSTSKHLLRAGLLLQVGAAACVVAAALVLLARRASWRAQPLITFCLGIGALGPLVYVILFLGPMGLVDPHTLISTETLLRMYIGLGLIATLLSMLGILILGQTERTKPRPRDCVVHKL